VVFQRNLEKMKRVLQRDDLMRLYIINIYSKRRNSSVAFNLAFSFANLPLVGDRIDRITNAIIDTITGAIAA